MTEESRIKKLQTGEAKIGLLFNPLSGRIRKRKDVIKHALGEIPGAITREATNVSEFNSTVSDFLHTGVDLLVIAGGDGTVQAVLNHLFTAHPPADWPILAIIPGGTTNMTALDRLLFNMRPYWGQEEQEPFHVTFIEQLRIKDVMKMISGRGAVLKEDNGYHSHNSSVLELVMDDDYIVDGESYRASSQNGPLNITAAGPVTFLTW